MKGFLKGAEIKVHTKYQLNAEAQLKFKLLDKNLKSL